MKKLITVLVIALLAWNGWLTYDLQQIKESSLQESQQAEPAGSASADGRTVVVNHTVNGYTTDVTQVVQKVEEQIVTVTKTVGEETTVSTGSVYYADSTGCWILTTASAVSDADAVSVTFHNEITMDAEIAGSDDLSDIALLIVHPDFDVTAIDIGTASAVSQGDYVTAVGPRLVTSQSGPVSFGVVSLPAQINVSVMNGENESSWINDVFTTDAEMGQMMDGAPLINLDGQLVGMMSNTLSRDNSSSGMNTALACSEISRIAEQLMAEGRVQRGYLGVTGENVGNLLNYQKSAMNLTLDTISGVMCADVEEGSPAQTAGLAQYDVITQIDDQPVVTMDDLKTILYSHQAGDEVTVTYTRSGTAGTVPVVLG